MIPSPDTPAESAGFCLEVLELTELAPRRVAELFVDAIETYADRSGGGEPPEPSDPDEIDAFNRLTNRTFGFVSFAALRCPERTAAMRDVLRSMREEIAERDGAERLPEAMDIIEAGGRSGDNAMATLVRRLRKI